MENTKVKVNDKITNLVILRTYGNNLAKKIIQK